MSTSQNLVVMPSKVNNLASSTNPSKKISPFGWQELQNQISAIRRKQYETGEGWYGEAACKVVPEIYQHYFDMGISLDSFVQDVSREISNVRPDEVVSICKDAGLLLPSASLVYPETCDYD